MASRTVFKVHSTSSGSREPLVAPLAPKPCSAIISSLTSFASFLCFFLAFACTSCLLGGTPFAFVYVEQCRALNQVKDKAKYDIEVTSFQLQVPTIISTSREGIA